MWHVFSHSQEELCLSLVSAPAPWSPTQSARRKQAKSVMLHFRGREARELKKAKEEQLSLRRGASRVAREVRAFWGKLNKVGALYFVFLGAVQLFFVYLCTVCGIGEAGKETEEEEEEEQCGGVRWGGD